VKSPSSTYQSKSTFRLKSTAIAAAILMTITSGLLHGRMSRRWGDDERMEQAARRLEMLPAQFGPWRQEATHELGRSAIELLSCRGYVSRGYRNQETGEYVKVAVMVGPGSKMSIHVPEICYEASNFTLIQPRTLAPLPRKDRNDGFWSVVFRVNDVSQQQLRVLYGWSEGTTWQAPRFPRWSVASAPVLYKIQLSHVQAASTTQAAAQSAAHSQLDLTNRSNTDTDPLRVDDVANANTNANADDDLARRFLADFLPVLDKHLIPRLDEG
jgi:hypothetical protein